ncbi:beta-galactosidase-1-like protein 2 [Neovison vison]|uniref:beta-galactosidase-1-like protein 2 n=1 Tax=Neovison vison TaxID=452646 RepID=UPI001CF0CC01|nr:beta-galactosidase-1-like protein 2 [Neogale vison]
MLTFLLRPVSILYLSSGLLVTAQFGGDFSPRMNQVSLTPSHIINRNVGLKVEGSSFTLDGFPFLIIAGTIHYFRVPREYWRDRLLKLKACGFNTVTTHIPWNLHEPRKGWFYLTANLDFTTFIAMASEVELWVILCPGPYIGSDLDLGGLPSWLLRDPKMKLRTTYRGFTKAVNHYFDKIIPMIVQLQYGKGGPIIAVQVENEYGSYRRDNRYMSYIKKALITRGIKVLLMTADNGDELTRGHLKQVLSTVHMKNIKKETYDTLLSIQPISSVKPICMEELSVNQGNGQSYGYILYETVITTSGLLTTKNHVQDRGQVFLDENFLGIFDRSTDQLTIPKKMVYNNNPTLRILVENQGRLAYGQDINKERKGITGDIYLNKSPLRNFKIHSLDMKTKFIQRDLPNIWKPAVFKHRGPAFFLGILRIGNDPRDTFIKMEGWTKGVIFINGKNLGRYWNIGPQETFYLPGPWLRPGSNEIIVFEEFKPGLEIQFTNISRLGY